MVVLRLSKHIALLLWILVAGVRPAIAVAEQDRTGARSFATIPVGSARVVLERDGSIAVREEDRELVSGTTLVVAAPGWRSSVSQRTCRPLQGYPRREKDAFVFKGEMAEESSGTLWRFEQRVCPADNGVRVTYEVQPVTDAQVAEVPVFIDLPISPWSGKDVWLLPTARGVFPTDATGNRHFLSGAARTVVLGGRDGGRLTLAFNKPTLCTVQDTRGSGGSTYQIYPRVIRRGTLQAGQVSRLEFVLTANDPKEYRFHEVPLVATGEAGIADVAANATEIPQYRKFEVSLQLSGTWDNPFDPTQVRLDAEFRAPDGATRLVPGFFCQDYERNDFDAANAAAWHRRMAKYLREIDPVDHVIHTNFGNLDGYPEVDGLAEMEIVSTNTYSRRDMGQTAAWGTRKMTALYRKPFLITEYGVGHHGGWVGEDPDGVIVHNGLWGAVMNGSAGTALPWGWGSWVDAQSAVYLAMRTGREEARATA